MRAGIDVRRVTVWLYILSSLTAALGGVLYAGRFSAGAAQAGEPLLLDSIAAVVIGGTLLTGGTGYLLGTVLGVMVLGLTQTIISFEGTLSSWWTKIFIGLLLFAFILLQRLITARRE